MRARSRVTTTSRPSRPPVSLPAADTRDTYRRHADRQTDTDTQDSRPVSLPAADTRDTYRHSRQSACLSVYNGHEGHVQTSQTDRQTPRQTHRHHTDTAVMSARLSACNGHTRRAHTSQTDRRINVTQTARHTHRHASGWCVALASESRGYLPLLLESLQLRLLPLRLGSPLLLFIVLARQKTVVNSHSQNHVLTKHSQLF